MVLIFLNKNFIKMGFSFLGQSIVCFFFLWVENTRFQLVTFWLLTITMLFASEMRFKNYLCGITYLGRKGNQDAGEESGISRSSSGKALLLNINSDFHVTLGRDKIPMQLPVITTQLRFSTTAWENSNSPRTDRYLLHWVTQMHSWESHRHVNVSGDRRVGYPEN